MIYHASFTDEETLDLLEQHKMEHFIAPGLAWLINTCHHASEWGLTPEVTKKMGYHRELEAAVETHEGRCASAACASCPAATTASPGRRTAPMPRTSSTSSRSSA